MIVLLIVHLQCGKQLFLSPLIISCVSESIKKLFAEKKVSASVKNASFAITAQY